MELNVLAIADRVTNETEAYTFLEELFWGDTPVCAHCQSEKVYFLTPGNGTTRKTRTGSMSPRRLWKCATCRKQYSVLTNTIFHGTKISIRKWIFVIFEMSANKNGLAAREIQRKYQLTAKSAWYMIHRIRAAMEQDGIVEAMTGTVIADETYIGGKAKNKHQQGKKPEAGNRAARGVNPRADKTAVVSLVDVKTGEVRSRVVADVNGDSLRAIFDAELDRLKTHLMTDSAKVYRPLGKGFASHEWVDHHNGEYVRGSVTTNHAEGYFSQLRRSLDGTHHQVSRKHLHRYLSEFDFRYSSCELSDSARMKKLMKQVGGKRLSYKPLVSTL